MLNITLRFGAGVRTLTSETGVLFDLNKMTNQEEKTTRRIVTEAARIRLQQKVAN